MVTGGLVTGKADSSAALRNDKQKTGNGKNDDARSGDDMVVAEAGEEVVEAFVGGLVVEET